MEKVFIKYQQTWKENMYVSRICSQFLATALATINWCWSVRQPGLQRPMQSKLKKNR